MAEAFLNRLGNGDFAAQSAGIEPGNLNPVVVEAMAEVGIDISGKTTTSVREVICRGETFDYVVTVCDETSAERCPWFPGQGTRLHWGFPDPSALQGGHEEKLAGTRAIRDEIRNRVSQWIEEMKGVP